MNAIVPQYQIEKGIPMPIKNNRYPWHLMEVGDSFAVPAETANIYSAASAQNKRGAAKFRACKTDGGFRVWRTA